MAAHPKWMSMNKKNATKNETAKCLCTYTFGCVHIYIYTRVGVCVV